jgi:hypothetical protein
LKNNIIAGKKNNLGPRAREAVRKSRKSKVGRRGGVTKPIVFVSFGVVRQPQYSKNNKGQVPVLKTG